MCFHTHPDLRQSSLIVRGVELFLHAHVDYIQNGPSHGSVVRGLARVERR